MARGNFKIDEGFTIFETNGTGSVQFIQGTSAPTATAKFNDAPIGSLYLRRDAEGELYRKEVDTDSATDWKRMVDESVYTALGIAFDDENFGTFTGDIISDNGTAKAGMQELETELVDTRGNTDDLITLSGVSENSSDLGLFTGSTIADNETVKGALQDLEDAVEAISGGSFETVAVSAGTPTTVSTCLVDDCNGAEWEVCVYETATESKRRFFKLTALHNGTTSADANDYDETIHSILKFAGNDIAGLTVTTKLAGTGASQTMGMEISATAAITVKVRRTDIPL